MMMDGIQDKPQWIAPEQVSKGVDIVLEINRWARPK
jgi:hypothetical protein